MHDGMLAILLGACLLLAAGVAPAADGPAVFRDHCAKCHGGSGKADTWRGFLSGAQDLTEPHFQRIRDDRDILEAINDGPGLMPSFADTLTPEEREALVGVVRGFRKATP